MTDGMHHRGTLDEYGGDQIVYVWDLTKLNATSAECFSLAAGSCPKPRVFGHLKLFIVPVIRERQKVGGQAALRFWLLRWWLRPEFRITMAK
jgi:hypothetical protein